MITDDLYIFARVMVAGSFAAAAKELGTAPSSVSRRILTLEHRLNTQLFVRNTRNMRPTSAGEQFYERIAPLLTELRVAQDDVLSDNQTVAGVLRIAASPSFGQYVLADLLTQFRMQYPDILFELLLSDRRIDMIDERVDLAIRHGALPDSDMLVTRLADTRYLAVASKDYLAKAPSLKKPSDIQNHSCLTFNLQHFRSSWVFCRDGSSTRQTVKPAIETSNAAMLAALVRWSGGVALLSDWMAGSDIKEGRMVRVLPDWEVGGAIAGSSISILCPPQQYRANKTELLRKFLMEAYQTLDL